MVQITIPSELDLYSSTDNPSDPGDIRVIKGALQTLTDCESTSNWASISTAKGSIVGLSNTIFHEGAASLKVQIEAKSTGIFKYTNPTTSWDFTASNYQYYSAHVYQSQFWGGTYDAQLCFGESTYNEQTLTKQTHQSNTWAVNQGSLSAIANGDKDAVTVIAVSIENESNFTLYAYIDYLYLDPGPSEIKGYDGGRVIIISPKVLYGTFTGDGTTGHTIYLSATSDSAAADRKGRPVYIRLMSSTAIQSIEWMSVQHTTDPATWSLKHLASSHEVGNQGIWEVGDGYFIVGSSNTNVNNVQYGFIALFED